MGQLLESNNSLLDFGYESTDNFYENSFRFNDLPPFTIGIVIYYVILFFVGVIGNIWVIKVLVYIVKNSGLSSNQNVFIYILCLAGVDLLVMMLIPILISDVLLSRWMFGDAFCKVYIALESVNKVLSTFILAALSFDRYLAVCRSDESRIIRTPKMTLIIIILIFVAVMLLLLPVYLYAEEVTGDDFDFVNNRTVAGAPQCVVNIGSEFIGLFSIYIFAVGFCLPSIFIIFCYATILIFVYKHARSIRGRQSQIPVKRLTCATLLIVLFTFVVGHRIGYQPF